MSHPTSALTAAALLVVAAGIGAQMPSTGQVAGRVVDGTSGEPIGSAVVTIAGPGGAARRVVVDPAGRFIFTDLPAGRFSVQATKPGYVAGGAGQQQATQLPQPLDIAAEQRIADLTLRLWKLGAIEGTVTGDANQALADVEVHALRRTLMGGQWRVADAATATTDDRGRYRLSGLPSGDYAIAARPARTRDVALLLATLSANPAVAADVMTAATMSGRGDLELDARVREYAMTVYPAAPAGARAAFIAVEPATDRAGVDFHLQAGRMFRVFGTVAGSVGPGVTVRLMPVDLRPGLDRMPLEIGVAACDDEGHFVFPAVPPGRYLAVAIQTPGATPPPAPLPIEPTLWGIVPIVVGIADVAGVTLTLHHGFTVSGHVDVIGSAGPSPDELSQVALRLDAIDQPAPAGNAQAWRGRVEPDGRFTTVGVPPGEYLLRVTAPPRGWTVASAIVDGHDILDEPITIGDRDVAGVSIRIGARPLASISGTVRDQEGQPASESTVVVFPTDRAAWRDTSPLARRLRMVRPLHSGTYGIQALPPGEYFVAAAQGALPASWQDPVQLEALSRRATRVRLDAGSARTVDAQVIK